MNKKVLMLTIMLLAMLTLAMVPVQAAPKKTKLDFELYMEGVNVPPWDRYWESGEMVVHIRGMNFDVLGDFYVVIGEDSPILLDPGDYSTSLDFNLNYKTNDCTLKVRETISIEYMELEGTIEILSVDKIYNVYAEDMYAEGTFVGHGTGDFEGVKVAGTSSMTPISPVMSAITRSGTVMGWPTT